MEPAGRAIALVRKGERLSLRFLERKKCLLTGEAQPVNFPSY